MKRTGRGMLQPRDGDDDGQMGRRRARSSGQTVAGGTQSRAWRGSARRLSSLCLDQILCFKHRRKVAKDNTVRFQLHTLQLLPGPERPSYAGAAVEVLEGLDGRLTVRHEGHIMAAQEAPPSPVFLRNGHGRSVESQEVV